MLYSLNQFRIAHFFFDNQRSALVWIPVRFYLGWLWIEAGWEKVTNPSGVWVGDKAGVAITGFLQGALKKTAEFCANPAACYPDVQWWYADFINSLALPNAKIFSYMVAYGELAVGIALVVGFLVGASAFFGVFMNFNYLLAGTVSVNPVMFLMGLFLMLAWRVAGYWGLDKWVLPLMHGNKPPPPARAGMRVF